MKETYTLSITGIKTEQEAIDIAEDGAAMMWAREGNKIVAYPSDAEFPTTIEKAVSGQDKSPWRPISEIESVGPDTILVLKYKGFQKFTVYTVSCGTCREVLGSYEKFIEIPECPPIQSQFPIEIPE